METSPAGLEPSHSDIQRGIERGDFLIDGVKGPVSSLEIPRINQIVEEPFPFPAQDAVFEQRQRVDLRTLPVGSYVIIKGKAAIDATDMPSAIYIVLKRKEGEIAVGNFSQDEQTIGFFVAQDTDLGTSIFDVVESSQQTKLTFFTYFPGQLAVGEPTIFPYFETKRKRVSLFKTRRVLTHGKYKSWGAVCAEIQVFEKK